MSLRALQIRPFGASKTALAAQPLRISVVCPRSPNVLSLSFQHTKLARIRVVQPPGPTTAQMLVTHHTEHSTAIPNVFDWGLAQLLKQSPMV